MCVLSDEIVKEPVEPKPASMYENNKLFGIVSKE